MVEIECLRGVLEAASFDALARLRIEVFREFPYLYEGTLEHERSYLREYAHSPRSTLLIARDGAEVVGASTATPLLDHGDADSCAAALRRVGYRPEDVYYFGESVLLSGYRGRGIGHAFFDRREASARSHGFRVCAFCAVERPRDHPLRPPDYLPHDAFWGRRGYVRQPEAVAQFTWRDLGMQEETAKPMVFWTKELGA